MDNLSMDASRARRDGLSYGYWKVIHPNTMGEVVVNDGNRICPYCGEPFFTKKKRMVFCGVQCQRKMSYKRVMERKAVKE